VAEAALLHLLLQRTAAHPYAVIDPMRQLCVTCEVGPGSTVQLEYWTTLLDLQLLDRVLSRYFDLASPPVASVPEPCLLQCVSW
jgi:hypothetical protein